MKYQLFSNQENGFLAFIYIESISYLNYWQKLYHCSFNKSKKDVSLFSSYDHIKKCRTSLFGVILIIYTPDLAPKMFVLTNFALLFFEFSYFYTKLLRSGTPFLLHYYSLPYTLIYKQQISWNIKSMTQYFVLFDQNKISTTTPLTNHQSKLRGKSST